MKTTHKKKNIVLYVDGETVDWEISSDNDSGLDPESRPNLMPTAMIKSCGGNAKLDPFVVVL